MSHWIIQQVTLYERVFESLTHFKLIWLRCNRHSPASWWSVTESVYDGQVWTGRCVNEPIILTGYFLDNPPNVHVKLTALLKRSWLHLFVFSAVDELQRGGWSLSSEEQKEALDSAEVSPDSLTHWLSSVCCSFCSARSVTHHLLHLREESVSQTCQEQARNHRHHTLPEGNEARCKMF